MFMLFSDNLKCYIILNVSLNQKILFITSPFKLGVYSPDFKSEKQAQGAWRLYCSSSQPSGSSFDAMSVSELLGLFNGFCLSLLLVL